MLSHLWYISKSHPLKSSLGLNDFYITLTLSLLYIIENYITYVKHVHVYILLLLLLLLLILNDIISIIYYIERDRLHIRCFASFSASLVFIPTG